VNEGCVPTKALIRSAEVMHLAARRAAEFGVEIEGNVRFNLKTAVARKDSIVRGIIDGIYGALNRRSEAVPRAIFSDPTLAAVGLTEAEARAQGYEVSVGSVPADGARAKAIGDNRGRLKAVVNSQTGEILGFHILAPHGDDLLHEAVAAMNNHGSIERISKSIHIHPTLSEMVKSAAKAAR